MRRSLRQRLRPVFSAPLREVHVIDMRYWEGVSPATRRKNGIDEILVMNNIKSACNYTFHDYLLAMT